MNYHYCYLLAHGILEMRKTIQRLILIRIYNCAFDILVFQLFIDLVINPLKKLNYVGTRK